MMELYCNNLVEQFLKLCNEVNFPGSLEKTEWVTQLIIFLGMLLNTITQTVSIPVDKRDKALKLLNIILNKKRVTILQV